MAPTVLLKQYTTTTKVLQNSNNRASQGTNSITLGLMAKTRKFTKSYHSTSGIVPGSSAPKRKSTNNNLNLDRNSMLGIPTRVYAISNMSASERKELQIILQRELEELRIVERKYLSSNYSNGGVHSSSHIAPNIKHSMFARGETGRHDASSIPASSDFNSSLMKQCEELLIYMMKHKNGSAFCEPVDPVKMCIPDYFTIITQPMDLGTVMKKLKSGAYRSPWGFASDIRLTFVNAKTYNPSGNPYHDLANKMSKLFESKFKAIEKKITTEVTMEREEAHPMLQAKRRKLLSKNPHRSPPQPLIVPSPTEKVEIKTESLDGDRLHVQRILKLLEDDLPEHVQDFLRRESFALDQQPCGNEIEIDVNSFNHDVVLQLKKLLNEHLDYLKSAANRKKEDHGVLEMLNQSGVSNSLILPPCKANEPDEEDVDVDIGGNDAPMITYPPIEIEKEKDVRNGRISGGSSSSSSGVSSSSSSDTDSSSSSDSESENANDYPPACSNKEDIQHVATPNHGNSDFLKPNDANKQFEQRIQSEATLFADDAAPQEILGENGQCERQVSPEKLIRAALLKNRFADTILKFREPFDKAENGDPEKIRREKEEYERRKKRDKAKIQAEAKAAEEACRQSEAAIAAEAKKKREDAREAARQALLRVEKTVEINGSSEFLNDLEILRTVSAPVGEHQHQLIASSINDTNLDPSQDCIGGRFMLGGNNPLEQLGLYIKEDEEEEEEENENVVVANVDRLDPSNTNSHIINDNGSIDENSVNNDNSTKNINGTNKSSSNNSSNAGGREVGDVDG